jgi:hypothetical protein
MSSATAASPSPAPTDIAAMMLWPQACPMAGSASYSAHTTTRNGPGPLRAEKAVSRPPTPRSTVKPASASASDSHAHARCSCMPSSGSA